MPLPLILAGIAIAAGGYGVKKGFDAKSDFDDANSVNERAKEIFEDSKEELESSREQAQHSMEALGTLKLYIKIHSSHL